MAIPWDLCDPEDRSIGLDVSHWQPRDPWRGVKELGVEWGIIKAWHGRYVVDTNVDQVENADEAGIISGRYAWLLPDSSLDLQLGAWCGKPNTDAISLTIDFEETSTTLRGQKLVSVLERAIEVCSDRMGRRPIIYTGNWYWVDYCKNVDSEIVSTCELHLAAYPRKNASGDRYRDAVAEVCGGVAPATPRPWRERGIQPWAWQFDGDKGLYLPGSHGGDVDVNVASRKKLLSMAGLATAPTDPAPAPETLRTASDESMGAGTPNAAASPIRAGGGDEDRTPIHLQSREDGK